MRKRKAFGLAVCLILCALAQAAPVFVSISPSSATVLSGGQVQFSATVTGTSDQGVTWTTSLGTITSSGLLTAPTVTSQTTLTVRARSTAKANRQNSVQVTVVLLPNPHSVGLSWTPSPWQNPVAFSVYKGQTSGGPYSQIASGLTLPNFTDANAFSGQTLFYVVTEVDTTTQAPSKYSNQATVVIP